jgi:chorismate-pyruvate lyase
VPPWAGVLTHFYRRLQLPLPPMERLAPEALPAVSRRLLAHNEDMTPTLERHYGDRLHLRVLSRTISPTIYLREVVLVLDQSGLPVEYGAICIYLGGFADPTRRLILEETLPFGRILEEERIAHLGWPQAFFQVQADTHMMRMLHFDKPQPLYGRRNVVLDGQRRLLAEVIEILPPDGGPRKDSQDGSGFHAKL